jgi:hypothetical protein
MRNGYSQLAKTSERQPVDRNRFSETPASQQEARHLSGPTGFRKTEAFEAKRGSEQIWKSRSPRTKVRHLQQQQVLKKRVCREFRPL